MDKSEVEDDYKWDRRFVFARDKSHKQAPGKFVDRVKGNKPKGGTLIVFAVVCKKQPIRDIEIAKLWVSKARRKQDRARSEGRISHRSERRYYECSKHEVPQFHLTKLGVDEYANLFESSARGEFVHVA